MVKFCCCPPNGFVKTVGFGILALSAGILVGRLCPAAVFAGLELVLLVFLGYICLFGR